MTSARALRAHLLAALAAAAPACSYSEYVAHAVVPMQPGVPLPEGVVADKEACEKLLERSIPIDPRRGEVLWCQGVSEGRPVQVLRCETERGRREIPLDPAVAASLGPVAAPTCEAVCRSQGAADADARVSSCFLEPPSSSAGPHLLVAWKRTSEKGWDPFPRWSLVRTWQGRRPAGFEDEPLGDTPGERFAAAAALEAAAVTAFEDLAAELAAHGAPRSLLAGCRRAAADEVRHARDVGALAAAFGGAVRARGVPARPGPRPLAALALENLVEGCVGEAFAAALAEHQRRAAAHPGVRRVARAIAREEAAHAALGFRVHAWLAARLTDAERLELADRFEARLDALAGEAVAPSTPALEALGFLAEEPARRLFAVLRASLWAPLASALRATANPAPGRPVA